MKILPTQNQEWGFWGTISNHLPPEKLRVMWNIAFLIIQEKTDFTPIETRNLLDSRWGRHTADMFLTSLEKGEKAFEKEFKTKIKPEELHKAYTYYIGKR